MTTTLTNAKTDLDLVADLVAQVELAERLRNELGHKIDKASLDAFKAGATHEQLRAIVGNTLIHRPTGLEILECCA